MYLIGLILAIFLTKTNGMDGRHIGVDNIAISHAGAKLIERFEGFRDEIYRCPAGKPTIGYGHVVNVGEEGLFANGLTQDGARALLITDLNDIYIPGIKRKVKVPLAQCQFDALGSFIYNLGETNLGDSTLLNLLNEDRYDQAALQFPRWCYAAGKYLPGLFKRRLAEMFIFQDHMNIPDELATIQLGKTEQTLLMAYQALNERLKQEAVEIYQAYKSNWR